MSGIGKWLLRKGSHDPSVQSIHSSLEDQVKAYFGRHPNGYQYAIEPDGIARPTAFDLTPLHGSVLAPDSVIMGFSVGGEIAEVLKQQEILLTAHFSIPSDMPLAAIFTSELANCLSEVSLGNAVYDYLYGLDDRSLSDLSVEVNGSCVISALRQS